MMFVCQAFNRVAFSYNTQMSRCDRAVFTTFSNQLDVDVIVAKLEKSLIAGGTPCRRMHISNEINQLATNAMH